MRNVLLAALVAVPLVFGASASAHDGYDGYNNNSDYYGPGGNTNSNEPYGGYGYQRDFYAEFYQRYLAFLRECRAHLAFHRDLRDLRWRSRHAYGDPYGARDADLAGRATHDLWHRDHPYANNCPTYREYYGWARGRRDLGWSGYGWGGYPNAYWRR